MAAENIDAFLKEKRKKGNLIDWQKVRLYGIPFITSAVFIGIVLFFIIPKINEIFSELGVVDQLTNEQARLQTLLADTRRLQSSIASLNTDLGIIETIAPSQETEVLVFRNKIQKLAEDNGLAFSFQLSNDANLQDQEIDSINSLSLKEVSTQFEVNGTFDDIETFITQLNTIDDFIIIREMSLNARIITGSEEIIDAENLDWALELTVAKYQFSSETDEIKAAYRKVDPKAQLDAVMESYLATRR